jgi:HNH endonuclease
VRLTEYARDVIEDAYDRLHKPDDFKGCWLWMGVCVNGYGQISISSKRYFMHRASWAHYNGDGYLDDDLIVHHTCERRACCNPDHLVAMTRKEHALIHNGRRFCIHGHDTFYEGRDDNYGCSACRRDKDWEKAR